MNFCKFRSAFLRASQERVKKGRCQDWVIGGKGVAFHSRMLGAVALAFLLAHPLTGQEENRPEKKERPPAPRAGTPRPGPAPAQQREALTPEQREELRESLREAWGDPAVMAAREEVQRATRAYQDAMQAVMKNAGPDKARLYETMQSTHEGRSQRRLGPAHPGRRSAAPGGEGVLLHPSLMERLGEEERKRVQAVETEAGKAESVQAAREKMNGVRQRMEALRSEQMEAARELREAVRKEMFRLDPELEALLKKAGPNRPPQGERRPARRKPEAAPPAPKPEAQGKSKPETKE